MPSQVRVVWDPGFTAYDFGAGHPMNPVRLDLTARLCEELGVFDHPGVEVFSPALPDDELLATVHDREYIAAVRAASEDPRSADLRRGLGTEDDPAFRGMHDASARRIDYLRRAVDIGADLGAEAVSFWAGIAPPDVVASPTGCTQTQTTSTTSSAWNPPRSLSTLYVRPSSTF